MSNVLSIEAILDLPDEESPLDKLEPVTVKASKDAEALANGLPRRLESGGRAYSEYDGSS